VKAQAQSDIDKYRQCAVEQLALSKFGLQRFSSDDSIKFYTGFPTYKHLTLFFMNLLNQILKPWFTAMLLGKDQVDLK